MTDPLPDWGFVTLARKGQSWSLVHQSGTTLDQTDEVPTTDRAAARRWMRDVLVERADVPPGLGEDAETYLLARQPGQRLSATPAASFHHDGLAWVLTDGQGHVTHRNDDIGVDDYDAALDWADRINRSQPGYRGPRRWRLNVGQFPDGTYCDPAGRLGPQRARRAWNRLLDRLHIR